MIQMKPVEIFEYWKLTVTQRSDSSWPANASTCLKSEAWSHYHYQTWSVCIKVSVTKERNKKEEIWKLPKQQHY